MGKIDKSGRPRKFNDDELLEIVKDYIENEHDKNEPIRITKIAKNIQDKGINIVYQDLNRYDDVKRYIDEYNDKFKSESNKDETKENIKVGGRPRKFDEDKLLIAVKGYVKNLNKGERIKVSRVAKHFQSIGINLTYQDLNRYHKVKQYIEDYNEKYQEILFGTLKKIDIEKQKEIFEQINPEEFLKRNKTPKEVEKALLDLNQCNEKLVEIIDKLQDKIILQNEKIIIQSNEIEDLNSKIKYLEIKYENQEKELKEEKKKNKEKIDKFNRRMAIYDLFIERYHYANLAEYALTLEASINADGIKKIDAFIDKDKYEKGELTLKDIADKYFSFQLAVENVINQNLRKNDEDYTWDEEVLKVYLDNYVDDEEENIDDSKLSLENGIESMNLNFDDLNSSLSILDDI